MKSKSRSFRSLIFPALLLALILPETAAFSFDDVGGDDVTAVDFYQLDQPSLDIAANGDIYVAFTFKDDAFDLSGIYVYRSLDGGTTWQRWGELVTRPGDNDHYNAPCLDIVEGVIDRCYLAFGQTGNYYPKVMMVSADLSETRADFSSPVTVLSNSGDDFLRPRFTTDVTGFDNFNIYLVAEDSQVGSGCDIVFTRSTDQGASFEPHYKIGELTNPDLDYRRPDISYGFGGYIHVVWDFANVSGDEDHALRFRRASGYAGGGISDWDRIWGLGTTSDGTSYVNGKIEASDTGLEVVVAYQRSHVSPEYHLEAATMYSTDSGAIYSGSTLHPDMVSLYDVKEQPGTGNWLIGGLSIDAAGIQRANVANLGSWSSFEAFGDGPAAGDGNFNPAMAVNPAFGYQAGMVWVNPAFQQPDFLMFDGEWRSGPGYPNLETGYPVSLANEPVSDPAVVDVDDDGDLEIVFGDLGGNIQVFQADGTPLPGWPVNISGSLSDGPVAVGDLRGTGEMYVVAGSANGWIHCYDAQGQVAPGNWPVYTFQNHPAYVALGAFGTGPYPRGVAIAVGPRGLFLDHAGRPFPGTVPKTMTRNATHPPAVGDVNGDGLVEIVYAQEELVVATRPGTTSSTFGSYMTHALSGSPTLADFDLDGDVEVVVPLENGDLHLLGDLGGEWPGFPFSSPYGVNLTSAALGNLLGNSVPEIATAALSWNVHVIMADGTQPGRWPADIGVTLMYGSPVIGEIEGASSDVIIANASSEAWAWNNYGDPVPGWPRPLDCQVIKSAAMGDIDLDGSGEIVLLGRTELLVFDVNKADTHPSRSWPMAAHDPQRTGCYNCPEDLVTSVDDDQDIVTRVSFAAPSPNPSSGATTFRFAVPGPAVVNLEVFDVRGHRVSLVTREEVGAGSHVASWGGLGDRGENLASGIYFARLRVEGPGIREELTRKITLTR